MPTYPRGTKNQVRSLVGTKLGYSQLSRIEDTMTSIGLFSRGFKSVYINEENEILGSCTQASLCLCV